MLNNKRYLIIAQKLIIFFSSDLMIVLDRILVLPRYGSLQYMTLFLMERIFTLGYIERKTCPNFVLQPAPGEGWL